MTTNELIRAVVQQRLGPITDDSDKWLVSCPGAAHHTHPDGIKDCAVYPHMDGRFPRVVLHCVHDSCHDDLGIAQQQVNEAIEDALRHGGYQPTPETDDEQQQRSQAAVLLAKKQQLQLMSARALPHVLYEYALSLDEFKASSPVALNGDPQAGYRLMLENLFEPTDSLWMGRETDSGGPSFTDHFQTVQYWLQHHPTAPYPFTAPSTFKPNTYSRSRANVHQPKYLVYESDTLDIQGQLAVARYLREKHAFDLHAAVFSGGKSIHFWFKLDFPDLLERLSPLLIGLRADRKVLRIAQPVRLPGYYRSENSKWQELLWLKSK